jgi:hypothetical protein
MTEWHRHRRWRHRLSHGAASPVRRIDPATYQPAQPHSSVRTQQNKSQADTADTTLTDAKRSADTERGEHE